MLLFIPVTKCGRFELDQNGFLLALSSVPSVASVPGYCGGADPGPCVSFPGKVTGSPAPGYAELIALPARHFLDPDTD